MKLDDFNNIDFKNTGNLPWPVKGVLLIVFFVLLVIGGYVVFWKPALDELDQAQSKEQDLRKTFLDKSAQAKNLEAYKQQMIDVEKTFGALLRQLPEKSQMDGLLTDINQSALAKGLDIEQFKPNPEVLSEFYAEMPISIRVTGSYQALGEFASEIARLSRIVILSNVSVSGVVKDANQPVDAKPASKDNKDKDSKLVMEVVANTYRYLDADEISAKKKADKLAAGKH